MDLEVDMVDINVRLLMCACTVDVQHEGDRCVST